MSETDFLFARPSFIEGLARALDLGNTLNIYNESKTVKEADENAIKNDFKMVGQDISQAIIAYEQEHKEK